MWLSELGYSFLVADGSEIFISLFLLVLAIYFHSNTAFVQSFQLRRCVVSLTSLEVLLAFSFCQILSPEHAVRHPRLFPEIAVNVLSVHQSCDISGQ